MDLISSIIYYLEFYTRNPLNDKYFLKESNYKLIDYIYSDKSPYRNMDKDF